MFQAIFIFEFNIQLQSYQSDSAIFWAVNEGLLSVFYAVICLLKCSTRCSKFLPGTKSPAPPYTQSHF